MQSNIIQIESLDAEGRGVARLPNEDGSEGKIIFIEGALPGEKVRFEAFRKKKSWEAGRALSIKRASTLRVEPKCPHFGVCGGCSMQHLEASAQVAVKQRVLEDNLWHIGRVKAEKILSPIHGPYWGYRYRARLSANYVPKKGGALVGFHERKSRYVADMTSCAVLPRHISDMLVPLRELINSLSIRDKLPQIELAIGEGQNQEGHAQKVTAMILRIMAPLTREDEAKLRAFADEHHVQWWLQTKGPDTVTLFYPDNQKLHYSLPEFGIQMPFKPSDFTQVNHQINRVLVTLAVRLLALQENHRVADLFCGLGNFTLPIATKVREVIGMEGSASLVERAGENAKINQLSAKTRFITQNLFEMNREAWTELGAFNRLLIDPPRDGAQAICQTLAELPDLHEGKAERIVYVSCNPSTLARDAGILVHEGGYKLKMAGVVNMFPHTSHVESIAVFDRQ